MMPSYRFTGPTAALNIISSAAHAPVLISPQGNDQQNYAAFWNPASTGTVCVTLTNGQSSSGAVSAFPVDGTPTTVQSFILPPLMQFPAVVATPGGPQGAFWCSGISGSGATTTIFVTPCSSQG